MIERQRCPWPNHDPLMIKYHDGEWGRPCRDDQRLFEYIVLDTFQAGLSWAIVLHKRENFRRAFSQFNPRAISQYKEPKLRQLLKNEGIIRNRLKIYGTVINAQAFLAIQKEFGSFAKYVWSFVGEKPIVNKPKQNSNIATTSPESDALSRDLKRRGFKFVGSTICYAFMQGAGLVNDHLVNCFRSSAQ